MTNTGPLIVAVHDGTFHTDDVFACATVSLAFPDRELEIIRTRDEASIAAADIVVDVGGTYDPARFRFDHHQKETAGARPNGIPYASFGLVWKEFGHVLTGSVESATFIDEQLIQNIDGADNGALDRVADKGVYAYTIGDMISALRPTWQEHTDMHEAFMSAVNVAIGILERAIAHTKAYANARVILEKAYDDAADKRIIDIGLEYPGWKEMTTSHPEPLFVIYRRDDGNWTVKAVPINVGEFANRLPFPESWAGLRGVQLEQASRVPGAIFCHNGRFIAVANSREGALKLAQNAINA